MGRRVNTRDYTGILFINVWGNACELVSAEDVCVLIYRRTEHMRSQRQSEETDGQV